MRKMNEEDFSVMAKWLSMREVLEFFGDVNSPFTIQQVIKKYGPRIDGQVPIHPYIVERNGEPIGFMQHYQLADQLAEEIQLEYGYPLALNVQGIDQFIGNPALFNQGIGTVMVKKFLNHLNALSTDRVVLDSAVSNLRAIRCYEKCGFVKVKRINSGGNWLMEYRNRK
ncbi:GNAT family N-acetyltransferase [Planococcus sp. CP5-4]|uniref:GNAT family N-acetyltransferase n=1 Tax=Planococcus sp. CP5-4 TaxID=2849036 RepID=UPI0027E578A5|nr:GNAT family N-acetyltransferase [Planococcus sp. CP5-4]